jgi:serine/threonine protein kinase
MIRGKPYTKAADIWSAGVLLYAITVGELPFEDDVVQRILQKIAFTEPQYPAFLSSQLIDLLKKILVKAPDERITIANIKRHPWLAHTEYAQLLGAPLSQDDAFAAHGVKRDLIDYIARLGVDVNLLPTQILEGEYNETTALYFILRREVITDRIRGLMQRLTTAHSQTTTGQKIHPPNGVVPNSPRSAAVPRPPVRAMIPLPHFRRNTGGVSPKAPVPLIGPVTAPSSPRRFSAVEEKDPLAATETHRESPRTVPKVVVPLSRARSHSLK